MTRGKWPSAYGTRTYALYLTWPPIWFARWFRGRR